MSEDNVLGQKVGLRDDYGLLFMDWEDSWVSIRSEMDMRAEEGGIMLCLAGGFGVNN